MATGGETMPFLEAARELLAFDPDAGVFRWKVRRNSFGGKVQEGSVAGTPSDQGYVMVGVLGRQYRAHRLAWLFMTGAMPSRGLEIDHINGDRSDNRWGNLRLVTRSQNNMNQGVKRNNKSGCKGVSFRKDTGKWHARITVAGQVRLLGNFDNLEDAVEARRAAEAEFFAEHASFDPTRVAVPRLMAPVAA